MKLTKEKLPSVLAFLAGEGNLLYPAVEEKVAKFVPFSKGLPIQMELVNTTLPPKDVLFPQTEKMYCYKTTDEGGLQVEELVKDEAQILFGVRPCDVQSILCMDDVFLTKTYSDAFYARKREGLTLVAAGCTTANETCFCTSMGLDPAKAPGADLFLQPTPNGWNISALTAKGEALAGRLQTAGLLDEGEEEALAPAQPLLKVDMNGVAEKMALMFDHPIWDEIYRPCLGCGTCTYLCPTCYCYDISAEMEGSEGTSFRCWDSCMFSEYSRMAGGHNPRPTKKERVRNRFMHKLTYFQQRYGKDLCVGCGRCMEKCPGAGLDIIQVIEMVREAKLDG